MKEHLPDLTTGLLRLKDILAPQGPIPVSKSTWWAGIRAGRFPKPIKLGPRIRAWRAEDIRALVEREPVINGPPLSFITTAPRD